MMVGGGEGEGGKREGMIWFEGRRGRKGAR